MSFDKNSNFNAQASFTGVKFGESKPVLEVELNELQDIQNEARADIIRDSIPSGFIQLSDIDYTSMSTNPNTIKLIGADSIAYVNGYKITIPKDTVITLNAPPEKAPREDLVFLEVWKEEVNKDSALTKFGGQGQASVPNTIKDSRYPVETSRRVQLKWRIRVVDNVDFKTYPLDGFTQDSGSADISKIQTKIRPQGGNEVPIADTNVAYWHNCFFSNKMRFANNPQLYNDIGIYTCGDGNSTSKNTLKTVDGYVYAIPMFRVYRRPSCGYMTTNEYNKISPLVEPLDTKKITKKEKVTHNDDKLQVKIKGRTLKNLLGDSGNCEDLSKWDVNGDTKVDKTVKLFGDSSIKFTNSAFIKKDILCDQTHKYFVSAHAYITSWTSGTPWIICTDYGSNTSGTVVSYDTTKLNQWQRKSTIVTGKANGGFRMYTPNSNSPVATVHIDGICVYDLTELYGVGKEPTDIAQLERELPYVSGIVSFGENNNIASVKSVGKNLLDLNKDINYMLINHAVPDNERLTNGLRSYANFSFKQGKGCVITTKPNQDYTISFNYNSYGQANGGYGYAIDFYNKQVIQNIAPPKQLSGTHSISFKALSDKTFINFGRVGGGDDKLGWVDFTDIQIEEGTVSTTSNLYKESQLLIPLKNPLRRLPNDVHDELDLVRKKYMQRIGSFIANGDFDWTKYTNESIDTDTICFHVYNKYMAKECVISDNFNYTRYAYNTPKEGIGGHPSIVGYIYIRILKSKLSTPDVAGFKKYLQEHPETIYYELAEPIEHDLADIIEGRVYVNDEVTTFITEQLSCEIKKPTEISNLVTNGDFSNGTTGWINPITISNNEASFTPTAQYQPVSTTISCPVNNKIYARASISASRNLVRLFICCKAGVVQGSQYHSGSGNYENLSFISTITAFDSGYPRIMVDDTSTSDFNLIKFKNVFTVDLTAMFGVGNEPSKEWCDKYLEFGTHYTFTSPTNTNVLAIKKDNKDVFKAVQGNVGVIPPSKYKEGSIYEVYYKTKPSEPYLPPVVDITCGSKTTSSNLGVDSLDLTNEVPYKKHSDGAINKVYIRPNVDSLLTKGMTSFTFTTLSTGDVTVGDYVEGTWGQATNTRTVYFRGYISNITKNSSVTISLTSPYSGSLGTWSVAQCQIEKVDRKDILFANIIDKEDLTNLRHLVSLTGFDNQGLLEQTFNSLLQGEDLN